MALAGFLLLVGGFYAGYALNVSSTLTARVADVASRHGTTACAAATRSRRRRGRCRPALFPAPGLGWAIRGICRRATPIWRWRASAKSWVSSGSSSSRSSMPHRRARVSHGLRSANDYGFFLATAVTLSLTIPVLVMAAGMLGVIPLTGVVTPFLSYGGSAMLAQFRGARHTQRDSPARRRRWRSRSRFVADALPGRHACRDCLDLADGVAARAGRLGRRDCGEASPRDSRPMACAAINTIRACSISPPPSRAGPSSIAPASRLRPRITASRSGRAITTQRSESPRARAVSSLSSGAIPSAARLFTCSANTQTRANWSASNTSYAERDFENQLRGFDDHATLVQTIDGAGRPVSDHAARLSRAPAAVAAPAPARRCHRQSLLRERPHGTVDDRRAVAGTRCGDSRAARGEIGPPPRRRRRHRCRHRRSSARSRATRSRHRMASVTSTAKMAVLMNALDRARYGLYPPGSTFKIVTAAAALRGLDAPPIKRLRAALLPDGRVGARIPGWGAGARRRAGRACARQHRHARWPGPFLQRVLRSTRCECWSGGASGYRGAIRDFTDAIDCGRARYAPRFRMPATVRGMWSRRRSGWRASSRRLPVTAGPASLALTLRFQSGGRSRYCRPASAARLARYLRDAVTRGTGRSLGTHPWRIAGKTGTAEVTGARSHSWFVGFAPFGSAQRRIAFAVVIENAGYGGLAAAPVAGEIVTAAADVGLLR